MSGREGLVRDPNAALISLDREQITKKFKRALLIDDERGYAESVQRYLALSGFEVSIVGSLDAAAQELLTRTYPIIICDNVFVDRSNRRGSEFIRDHADLFGSGKVVLMTGYPERHIIDAEILRMRGVIVLRKEPGSIETLKEICQREALSRADQFMDKLAQICTSLVENVEDPHELNGVFIDTFLVHRARAYLINYMKKFPEQDTPQFVIMGKAYSPANLIAEIETGTDVSKELIDQLLNDILE